MVGRRQHSSMTMEGNSRIEGLRVGTQSTIPDNLSHKGRVWYNEAEESLYYSKNASGLIVPTKLLDNELKWRDLTAPITQNSGVGISTPNWETFVGEYSAMLFIATKVQSIQVCFHVNHDYALGTDIFPHVHWSPKVSGETGTVRWGIELMIAQGHQQDSFIAPSDISYIEQAATGNTTDPFVHMVAESTTGLYDARLEPDTLIYCRVFRDTGHPNDTAGDVYGLTVDLHHQIDEIGTVSKSPDFYVRT